jgi:hypothetical protein
MANTSEYAADKINGTNKSDNREYVVYKTSISKSVDVRNKW